MKLEVDRGVFSPKWFESSALFCEMFPDVSGLRVLDMGCGCGVMAIHTALKGAVNADGVDIVPEAVKNTRRNAMRLGVANKIRTWQSDLFNKVPPRNQYDIIFWNPPWVFIDSDYGYKSDLEMSIFSPGYRSLSRFLEEAPLRLRFDGRVLLGFGDFGDIKRLKKMARQFQYSIKGVERRIGKPPTCYNYFLYDLRPRQDTPARNPVWDIVQ